MVRKKATTASKSSRNNGFLLFITALLIFGLFIIYNATAYYSQQVFENPLRFVYLQIGWILVGGVGFFIFSKYDYNKLGKISFVLFVTSIIFLIILGFVGMLVCRNPNDTGLSFIPCINGASRWFYFNPPPFPEIPILGVLGFQPAELAKLSLIIYLSTQLSKFGKKKNPGLDPFIVYIGTTVLFSFLLMLQPNMSTAILIFMIGSVIYFVSNYSLKPLLVSLPTLGILGVLITLASSYRRERLMTLVGLNAGDALDSGYHIRQVLIALGSGGFFGLGFGQSRQKYQYLPEVASDSIFAIIGEEFGFIGTTVVVLMFGYLIYTGIKIAKNAPNLLGRMLATGIISWLGLQFFINVAAMTKLIPLTGVPIPFISYGGSSMVFSLVALGILRNIQLQSKLG